MRKIFFPPRLVFFTFLILSLLMATSASAATITTGELYSPITCPSCGVSGAAKVTVAPTCIKDGVGVMTNRACSCAATVTIPASAFTNHSWVSATVDATCTTPGKTGSRCEYCLTWRSDATTIPVTAHTMSAWAAKDNTSHSRFCTVAGCSYTECEDHKGGTATCASKAICEVCGRAYGSASSMHDWKLTSQDATQHTYTCSVCQRTKSEAHDWGAWTSTSSSMTHIHTCTQCGEIVRAAHSFTYAANGSQHTATCSDCGYSFSESHDLPDTWYVNPSNSAQHMRRCTKCNAGDRQGHTWGSWVCNDDGTHTRTCTANGCGATETAKCSYVWQKASTPGYHTKYCATCGDYSNTGKHSGGTANCVTLAVCSTCGLSYGSYGSHEMETYQQSPDMYNESTHTLNCVNCSHSVTDTHTLIRYSCSSDEFHRTKCRDCVYTFFEDHRFTYVNNGSNHTGTCSLCNDQVTSSHNFEAIYSYTNKVHTWICTQCKAPYEEAHTMTDWDADDTSTCSRHCTTANCNYTEQLEHDWVYYDVGADTYHSGKCSRCGHGTGAAHDYGDWTRADENNHQRTCSVCGHIQTEAHTGGTATCLTPKICTVCNTPYGEANGHGDLYNVIIDQPTCVNPGTVELYCEDCHMLITTIHPGASHEPKMTTIVAATCCEAGYSQLICNNCQQEVNNGQQYPIAATGLHAEDWRETTAATCTTGGVETLYCGNSGKLLGDTRSTAKLGHDMTGDPVVTPATCTAEGSSVKTCQRPGCTHSETTILPILDHVEGEPVTDPEPTCCNEGLKSWYCVNCNTLLRTEELDPLGHPVEDVDFKWVESKAPTCTEEGEEKKVCAHSGKDLGETRTIPALGHIYVGLWEVGESDTHHRDCYRCGAGCRNVECTYLPLIIDDVEYQVCPVCGRFHNQKLEVVAEADITIVTGSKPGVSLVRMLADPFGADEIRYPAIMTAIFEADGYIADPDQNVTGITVILPVDAMASFKLVFVHMDDATGELVWTDVPYTLENGILTFAVEEMGLFLFVAE